MKLSVVVVLPVSLSLGIPGIAGTGSQARTIGGTGRGRAPGRHAIGVGRRRRSQGTRTAIGTNCGDGMHDLHRPGLVVGIGETAGTGVGVNGTVSGIIAIIGTTIGRAMRVIVGRFVANGLARPTAMIVIIGEIIPVVVIPKFAVTQRLRTVTIHITQPGIVEGHGGERMPGPVLIHGGGNAVEHMFTSTPR